MYLEPTLLLSQSDDVLELDELWSYVGTKKREVWIWIALCQRTRQVVAWHFGNRSERTCRRLWEKVPQSYKTSRLYSDFWKAYQAVLPPELHQACGKEEGQTNHVERFNLTLRQRPPRLVRKTLSFSKSTLMHVIQLRLFFIQYNPTASKGSTPQNKPPPEEKFRKLPGQNGHQCRFELEQGRKWEKRS
jgi:insertion element IS1 protein InsB